MHQEAGASGGLWPCIGISLRWCALPTRLCVLHSPHTHTYTNTRAHTRTHPSESPHASSCACVRTPLTMCKCAPPPPNARACLQQGLLVPTQPLGAAQPPPLQGLHGIGTAGAGGMAVGLTGMPLGGCGRVARRRAFLSGSRGRRIWVGLAGVHERGRMRMGSGCILLCWAGAAGVSPRMMTPLPIGSERGRSFGSGTAPPGRRSLRCEPRKESAAAYGASSRVAGHCVYTWHICQPVSSFARRHGVSAWLAESLHPNRPEVTLKGTSVWWLHEPGLDAPALCSVRFCPVGWCSAGAASTGQRLAGGCPLRAWLPPACARAAPMRP